MRVAHRFDCQLRIALSSRCLVRVNLATTSLRAPGYRLIGKGQDAQVFNDFVDLDVFNEAVRTRFNQTDQFGRLISKFEDPDRIARLVFFASNGSPDFFGWDPDDIRDSKLHEYGVYVVERVEGKSHLSASSFTEFVHKQITEQTEGSEEGTTSFTEAIFRSYSRHKAEGSWLSNARVLWRRTK